MGLLRNFADFSSVFVTLYAAENAYDNSGRHTEAR